jgi:hypothetical protein
VLCCDTQKRTYRKQPGGAADVTAQTYARLPGEAAITMNLMRAVGGGCRMDPGQRKLCK